MTAVEYLIKEFSNILGKIQTEPLQDLFLIDAIKKAKEMEKQQQDEKWDDGFDSGYYGRDHDDEDDEFLDNF
jgi:hypothetical protein